MRGLMFNFINFDFVVDILCFAGLCYVFIEVVEIFILMNMANDFQLYLYSCYECECLCKKTKK